MSRAGLPTIAQIQQATAREFNVPVEQMREPSPTRKCFRNGYAASRPRQAAIALAFLLTDHSRARIGHFFGGRDPTTVLHASRVVAKRCRTDPRLHERLRRITLELIRSQAQ